jgi:hypothetical protein
MMKIPNGAAGSTVVGQESPVLEVTAGSNSWAATVMDMFTEPGGAPVRP